MSEQPPRDIAINDPEDYSTSERLKHIYQARAELREMRREAALHRHTRPKKALAYYRTAVESYLMELDTLFQRDEEGRYLWNEHLFGTVMIAPPGDFQKVRGHYVDKDYPMKNNTNLKVASIPDPKYVEFRGLQSLFDVESPIRCTFEFPSVSELSGEPEITLVGEERVSWTTLNEMVSKTNEYVSDLGIGLDVDETDEWKI